MSSENQDWLSAASDNQPIGKAQLDSLLSSAELQHKLERYQTIGAVLRREAKSPLPEDFANDFATLLDTFDRGFAVLEPLPPISGFSGH